jgi:hypothetical protein
VVLVMVHVGPAVANVEPLYDVTTYVVAVPSAVKVTFTEVALTIATVGVPIAANVVIDAEVAAVALVELPVGVTVNVYAVPLVSPVTVQLWAPVGAVVVLATEHPLLEGVDVTVKVDEVPSAVKLTVTDPAPALATVGVASADDGVTELEAFAETIDVIPLPLGVTLNVYPVPDVNPTTVQLSEVAAAAGVVAEVAHVKPPGVELTV